MRMHAVNCFDLGRHSLYSLKRSPWWRLSAEGMWVVALISFLSTPQVPDFPQHGLLLLFLKTYCVSTLDRLLSESNRDARAWQCKRLQVSIHCGFHFSCCLWCWTRGWLTSSSQTKTNNLHQQINLVLYCERTSNYPGLLCAGPKFSPLKPLGCFPSMHWWRICCLQARNGQSLPLGSTHCCMGLMVNRLRDA